MRDNIQKVKTEALAPALLCVREGSYGVLIQDDSVLLCAGSAFGRTVINFPGGEPSDGEIAEQALVREFFEETGITVQVREHLYTSDDRIFVSPDIANTRMLNRYYRVFGDSKAIDLGRKDAEVDYLFWSRVSDLPLPEMLEVDAVFSKWLLDGINLQNRA